MVGKWLYLTSINEDADCCYVVVMGWKQMVKGIDVSAIELECSVQWHIQEKPVHGRDIDGGMFQMSMIDCPRESGALVKIFGCRM